MFHARSGVGYDVALDFAELADLQATGDDV